MSTVDMLKLPLRILAIIAVVFGGLASAQAEDDVHWQVGKYAIDLVWTGPSDEWPSEQRFTISSHGESVYQIENRRVMTDWKDFMLDVPDGIKPPEAANNGAEDILHLGTPTFVAMDWSGGAHCCFTLHIVMLGDHAQALPPIELLDGNEIGFVERPSRKQVVLLIQDYTFRYWRASFAASALVEVPYSFDAVKKAYLPDAELMRQSVPSDAVLATWRDEAKAADHIDLGVPRAITQRVLELIYSGNLNTARSFLASVWPYTKEQEARYWDDMIKCQIKFSSAWPAIAKLNGLRPDKPAKGCQKGFG